MTVYGMNHVALEVTDVDLAVKFYSDVFGLELQRGGEGQAFFKVGERQFLALFESAERSPDLGSRSRLVLALHTTGVPAVTSVGALLARPQGAERRRPSIERGRSV